MSQENTHQTATEAAEMRTNALIQETNDVTWLTVVLIAISLISNIRRKYEVSLGYGRICSSLPLLALLAIKQSIIFVTPCWYAKRGRVIFSEPRAVVSAPLSKSSPRTPEEYRCAAACRDVCPFESAMDVLALWSSSNLTTSSWPSSVAKCNWALP